MKRLFILVTTLWVTLILCFGGNVSAQSGQLDSAEAGSLEFLLKFAELKQRVYADYGEEFNHPTFADFSAEEQLLFENLESLVDFYGIDVSDDYNGGQISDDLYWRGCSVVMEAYPELDFMCSISFMGAMDWEVLEPVPEAAAISAYLEELGIREFKKALETTDEGPLIDAYAEMLGMAYDHLLKFAAMIHEDAFDYVAQLIEQAEVDEALAEAAARLYENFVINSGLNDAWYDPAIRGQGFTVSVFEDKGLVFLTWLTYDTELPSPDASANLGAAGQRWLTATGEYEGSQAELVVYSSSGGLFDASLPVPEISPIGSISLQFDDCYSGTVTYDLPGIGRSGSIPIQRVATDNVCNCEDVVYAVR